MAVPVLSLSLTHVIYNRNRKISTYVHKYKAPTKSKKPIFYFVARFLACATTYSNTTSDRMCIYFGGQPSTHPYLYNKDDSGTVCANLECTNEHPQRNWLALPHMHMYMCMCVIQLSMRYLASNDSQEVRHSNIHCLVEFNTLDKQFICLWCYKITHGNSYCGACYHIFSNNFYVIFRFIGRLAN